MSDEKVRELLGYIYTPRAVNIWVNEANEKGVPVEDQVRQAEQMVVETFDKHGLELPEGVGQQ